MRWIALLTMAALTACGSAPPAPEPAAPAEVAPVDSRAGPTLGGLLAELEGSLPDSTLPQLPGNTNEVPRFEPRADWRGRVRAAGDDVQALARLLGELEAGVAERAKTADWKERASEWREELGAVASEWDLVLCLAELESHLKRDAFVDGWKVRRPRWIDDLKVAAGLTPELSQRPTRERTPHRGSLWVVRNRTKHPLVVRWSGPTQGLRTIAAGKQAQVPLSPGQYLVQARSPDAAAPRIRVIEIEAGYRYTQTFGLE